MNKFPPLSASGNMHLHALLRICTVILISSVAFVSVIPVLADEVQQEENTQITFRLTDLGDSPILRVALMKEGESSKNGMVRQLQNIAYNSETSEISWSPCNDNSCAYSSTSTSGGNSGRDQLILEITFQNPAVDVSSCHGDPTCERLKGGVYTKSGMLNGIFYTGKTYLVSVDSLQAGIGEAFEIALEK